MQVDDAKIITLMIIDGDDAGKSVCVTREVADMIIIIHIRHHGRYLLRLFLRQIAETLMHVKQAEHLNLLSRALSELDLEHSARECPREPLPAERGRTGVLSREEAEAWMDADVVARDRIAHRHGSSGIDREQLDHW